MRTRSVTVFLSSVLLASTLQANTAESSRVVGHHELQQAIRFNTPPSGYIDLSYCDSVKSVGNMPLDRKTYRLSFDENFSFNPDNGELSTVIDTPVLQSLTVGRTTVLSSISAKAIISSVPKSPYLRYQIYTSENNRTDMRTYMCDWKKAVYLWK